MTGRRVLASVFFVLSISAPWAAGQAQVPGGLAISGPNPWIDPTSPSYGAKCTGTGGANDETAVIQGALTTIAANGGGTLFIPPTANGCLISGYHQLINSATTTSTNCTGLTNDGSCTVSIMLGTSLPAGLVMNGLVNIHNVSPGARTIFNGTYVIAGTGKMNSGGVCGGSGSNYCITYAIPWVGSGNDSGTVNSYSYAEIGLYYVGSNLKVLGAAAGSGSPSPSGSQLVTNQPITILTTMSTAAPASGPDVQNITFVDNGNAYAGLNIGNTTGFNISNDGFSGFLATGSIAKNDVQGGAAIVAAAGQATTNVANTATPWVQFGKLENNHINARIGFTSKFNFSSVTFDNNTVSCGGTGNPNKSSIGLDIGGLWYLANGSSTTGGENRVINQQTQGCMIGVLLGAQNNDRVEEKLENDGSTACDGGTTTYCSIGMALLSTTNSPLHAESKYVATGLYIDTNSKNNAVYENTTWVPQGPPSSTQQANGGTLNNFCPGGVGSGCPIGGSGYIFNTASLVVDSAVAPTTTVLGTNSGQTFAMDYLPTTNSTFTTDNEPSGINVSVASTTVPNVAVAAHADSSGSDIFDAFANAGTVPVFSIGTGGVPAIGNWGSVTGVGTYNNNGSGYALGDIIKVSGGNYGAILKVTSLSGTGVNGVSVVAGGLEYSATMYNTTGGSGSSLQITPTIASSGSVNASLVFGNSSNNFTTTLAVSTAPSSSISVALPSASGTLATTLDTVQDPAAAKTFNMGNSNGVTFSGGTATTANVLAVSDGASNSGSGPLLNVSSGSSSSAVPFRLTAKGSSNGVAVSSSGVLAKYGTGSVNADQCNSATCGTVTSVTFTGDGVVDSSTPSAAVTTSGTVTATVLSQAKNTVLAGPSSGSNAPPTFRALVGADMPSAKGIYHTNCNGQVASAKTAFMPGFGNGVGTTACTSLTNGTANGGMPITSAGTIKNLYVNAGTAGNGTGAGTVNIYINGTTNSTVTCSLNSTSSCFDNSHSHSVAAADVISIQLVSITSDSTATVSVAFELWN